VGFLFSFYMIVGIPSCTQGGYYIVELLNNYSAVYSIMMAVLVENLVIAYIYGNLNTKNQYKRFFEKLLKNFFFLKGTERFCNDIHEMINIKPGKFWIFCWKYITPSCLTVRIINILAFENQIKLIFKSKQIQVHFDYGNIWLCSIRDTPNKPSVCLSVLG